MGVLHHKHRACRPQLSFCRQQIQHKSSVGAVPRSLYVYIFIKLHITAQSGPVIRVILIYVCMVITYSRVWINRVRLPILLVISWNRENNIPLSPCVPENLVSRDGFSRPVPRQPAHLHTQAESGAYLRDSSRVPRRRPFMETAIRHRVSPEFIGSRNCVPMAFTAESPPAQGQ